MTFGGRSFGVRAKLTRMAAVLRWALTLPVLPALRLADPGQAPRPSGKPVAWGYWGPVAPNHWGELSPDFALCSTGTRQSPIDLADYTEDSGAPPLALEYSSEPRRVEHNGIVAHVEYGNGDTLAVGESVYNLLSMHIHVHAEHQVDGQLYPAEMHLVHATVEGSLAVVGQIFRLGVADPVVQALIDAYPRPGEAVTSGLNLNASRFVPGDLGYYHYEGSLTTPPGAEGVDWYVLRETRTISQEQVNRIAALHNGFNHRPIQARNGRPIIYTGPRPAC